MIAAKKSSNLKGDGYKSVIHMVLDGAGYYRSKEVVDEAKKLGIILHYLPPYSPNLNPIE